MDILAVEKEPKRGLAARGSWCKCTRWRIRDVVQCGIDRDAAAAVQVEGDLAGRALQGGPRACGTRPYGRTKSCVAASASGTRAL